MKKPLASAFLLSLLSPVFAQLGDMIEMEGQSGAAPSEFSEEELLESWGWLVAERYNLSGMEMTPVEMESVARGMLAQAQGEPPPTELNRSMLILQDYFNRREEGILRRQLERNREIEQEFFDSLFGTPGILSLGSGLYYEIIAPGNETRPTVEDTVTVRYEGRFLDGTVFDTTEGRDPATFPLGGVIEAWRQGVPLIGEGGKLKLFVPSKLGYGDNPQSGIPPGSPLVFEIELLKVAPPESPEAEQSAAPEPPSSPAVESQ